MATITAISSAAPVPQLAPKATGRGLGTMLYRELFSSLAAEDVHRALAGITLPNPGSVGLHEALGFSAIGVYCGVGYKLGAWHDVGWWELSLSTKPGPPEPPIELDRPSRASDWQAALTAGEQLLSL